MSDEVVPTPRRSQRGYWLLIAVQWLLLTLALTGTMTRSALAMADYVSPNLSPGWLAVAAFVMGLLFTIWTAVPALVGALAAYLLAGGIRDAVERRRTGAGADALPWWERSEGRRDIGT